MISLLELAKLSEAVYDVPPKAVDGWTLGAYRLGRSGGLWEDLQAAIYNKAGGGTVVAFRGTNLSMSAILGTAQDLDADVTLGAGANINAYNAAAKFMEKVANRPEVIVTGHSLGGAVAQIIGNRWRLRIATFNAPGVGVLSSRNIGEANPIMFGVRTLGMVGSEVEHPWQAVSDMGSAFHRMKGVNLRLDGDIVSKIGEHYGKLLTIAGPSGAGALEQHKIGSVISALEKRTDVANRDILSFG